MSKCQHISIILNGFLIVALRYIYINLISGKFHLFRLSGFLEVRARVTYLSVVLSVENGWPILDNVFLCF